MQLTLNRYQQRKINNKETRVSRDGERGNKIIITARQRQRVRVRLRLRERAKEKILLLQRRQHCCYRYTDWKSIIAFPQHLLLLGRLQFHFDRMFSNVLCSWFAFYFLLPVRRLPPASSCRLPAGCCLKQTAIQCKARQCSPQGWPWPCAWLIVVLETSCNYCVISAQLSIQLTLLAHSCNKDMPEIMYNCYS